jgi:hypothetical protein
MCTNAANEALNALHLVDGKKDALVVTVEYGPYMN